MNQLPQQISNNSATGGPRVPVSVHPLIKTSYVALSPQDQFINNWETSNLVTLSGFNSGGLGLTDHTMATNLNKVQAYTASVTGSNSSNFFVIGGLMNQRHFTNTLTGTTTASLSDIAGNGEMGVFSIRKIYFDTKIEPGSLTATVTGTNSFGVDMAGDYYDSGSGELKAKTSHGGAVDAGETIGAVLVDEGMFVVTSSTMREVATAVTAVKYRTSVLNTTISVFCKCTPASLNFTLNPTSYSISSISGTAEAAIGAISQSFNNILTNSTITANTNHAAYMPGLVSSGAGWSPYITTVGLYDDANDLLAVAKVATPLKKPNDLPLTFKVQIDV